MSRNYGPLLLITFALLLVAVPAAADTTGKLSGTVTDGTSPLPGVTITIASPAMIGGPKVAVTEADGTYTFLSLAPGEYTVRAELDGFATVEQEAVPVRLDRNTQLAITLSLASLAEQITVTGEAPVVDPEQVTIGQVYQQQYLEKAAVGANNRDYLDVIGTAAGVVGTGNVNVFGSTGSENVYLVDGVSTTDPVTATFGTNFNYDAIQEISFLTGGFDAEYGGATGGIVNLLTKSGGNDFHGTFDMRYRDSGFNENGDHFDKDENDVNFIKPAATLGGPVMEDKLWFFASYEDIDTERTPTGSVLTRKFEGQNYIGKLTWQANQSWQVVGKYSSDPAEIFAGNASRFIRPEAAPLQEQGGDHYGATVTGALGTDAILDFSYGVNRQELNSFPASGDLDTPGVTDDATGISSVNHTNAQFSKRDRDELKGSYTRFVDALGGNHEFKVGLEFQDLAFETANNTTGGAEYVDRGGAPRLLFVTPVSAAQNFTGDGVSAFVQDAWSLGKGLTLRLGVRYDEVTFDDNEGQEVATLDKVQPRLGFAWDALGNATTIVRGYWGRFMHPNALTLPSFARTQFTPTELYISCTRFFGTRAACANTLGVVIDDPLGKDPNGFGLFDVLTTAPNQVADNLSAMYADSWSIGVERQLGNRTSVELSYVEKDTKDIFEDTCNGNVSSPGASDACDFYVMANIAGLRRNYEAIILRAETRAFTWLHLNASYTYSKSRGNIGGTQNAGTDFDIFPIHFENRYGNLGDDQRHRVKLNGFVDLPLDFGFGFTGFWASEFPYSAVEDVDPYGVRFAEPRGSRRAADEYQLDLELRKGFKFGSLRTELIAAVYNATGHEGVIDVCDDFDSGCGAIPFGGATAFQQPRSYEAGFRLVF